MSEQLTFTKDPIRPGDLVQPAAVVMDKRFNTKRIALSLWAEPNNSVDRNGYMGKDDVALVIAFKDNQCLVTCQERLGWIQVALLERVRT